MPLFGYNQRDLDEAFRRGVETGRKLEQAKQLCSEVEKLRKSVQERTEAMHQRIDRVDEALSRRTHL